MLPPETTTITASPYRWRDPATIPLRPWVYGRYLLRGTVTAVIAPGGVGKSTFLAGTSLAMVTGRALLGKTVWDGVKRVWIWNLEDDLDELSRSIQAAAKHFGLAEEGVSDRLFVDSAMDGSGLCTAVEDESGFRLLMPIYEALEAELTRRGIDVLVVDPFVSSHEVEENANSKINKIVKAWGRVAKAANCAIVLVHHTSKAGAAEVTALSARGAVALVNACRSAVVLNRMDAEAAVKLGIDGDDERRRYFAVMDDKHNRAPAEKADWYRLVSVDLGNGGSGNGDSIGVAEPWCPPDPFEGVTADHLYRVQCLVDESGDYRESSQANRWVGFAVAQVLGISADKSAKAERARIAGLLRQWLANGSLKVVRKRDEDGDERPFVQVGEWAVQGTPPPRKGGVGTGGEGRADLTPTPPPPFRGGGGGVSAGQSAKVGATAGGDAAFPHGNPAFKPIDQRDPFSDAEWPDD